MLQGLVEKVNNMHAKIEKFSRDIKSITKKNLMEKLEIKSSVSEKNNSLDRINSKPDIAGKGEPMNLDMRQQKASKLRKIVRGKKKKKDLSVQYLWNNTQWFNIQVIEVSERKERQNGEEIYEEIMTKNVLQFDERHQFINPRS